MNRRWSDFANFPNVSRNSAVSRRVRKVSMRYRRRRRRGYFPVSRSRGPSSYTRPARMSARARFRDATAAEVYAQRSSPEMTSAGRSWTASSSTRTSSWLPSPIPRRRRTSAGKVTRPCRFTAMRVLAICVTLVTKCHYVNSPPQAATALPSLSWVGTRHPSERHAVSLTRNLWRPGPTAPALCLLGARPSDAELQSRVSTRSISPGVPAPTNITVSSSAILAASPSLRRSASSPARNSIAPCTTNA